MAEFYGWIGKILRVDLTTRKISTVPTGNYVPKFIGGRGVGAKIIWDEVPPHVGAFDPENGLTFMTGPLAGTPAPTGGRTIVSGVAPLGYPEEVYLRSALGGHWGPELKFAGYDGIIIQGKAAKPAYLWIHDGEVEIRDAKDLWGLNTYATQQDIWKRHGKSTKSLTIGPAGEHLVRLAVILTDDSSASGIPGYGAVMGSKNLKAIAVRGTGGVRVAKPQELLDALYHFQRLVTRKEGEAEPAAGLRGQTYRINRYVGSKLQELEEKGAIRRGFSGCFACPVCCGLSIRFKDGSYVGTGNIRCHEMTSAKGEQRYYNEEKPFGPHAYATWKLYDLLGICGPANKGACEFYLPLFGQGVLNKENIGLSADQIGSEEFYKEFIHKIVYREGIGDLLAEGPGRACNRLGGEAIHLYELFALQSGTHGGHGAWKENRLGAIHRVTSTITGLDSRGLQSQSYEPGNALHPLRVPKGSKEYKETIKAMNRKLWGSEKASDLTTWEYKALQALTIQNWKIMTDSLVACSFNFPLAVSTYTPDHMGDLSIERRLYSSVTGMDITEEEWMRTADRVYMLERALLTRHGHTRKNDWFFDSVFEANKTWLDKEGLSESLDDYYTLRGIDVATGIPRRSTLERLDLKDVADDLEKKYSIKVPA
ncbi:MAG: aldehyde ferredoxin oxidoreductase N-terminal domain-containing protein [Thermodesulfobacteriota bacterium]